MPSYTDRFEDIVREFEEAGIPVDAPGFFDHPAFAERLAGDPDYRNLYARFVKERPYTPEYLAYAEKTLQTVCDILHQELIEDGRLGACIDMSLALSRMLDKLGVWNFPVLGALTTTYPEHTEIPRGFYWPVDHGAIDAGHAWLFAPPFTVIDLTFGRQYFNPGVEAYHPDAVYSREVSDVPVLIEDICSSSILMEMDAQGLTWDLKGLFSTHPHFEAFFKTFPRAVVTHAGAAHKFIPVAVGVLDQPLEEMTDLQLNGMSGHAIFEEKIKPLFA